MYIIIHIINKFSFPGCLKVHRTNRRRRPRLLLRRQLQVRWRRQDPHKVRSLLRARHLHPSPWPLAVLGDRCLRPGAPHTARKLLFQPPHPSTPPGVCATTCKVRPTGLLNSRVLIQSIFISLSDILVSDINIIISS